MNKEKEAVFIPGGGVPPKVSEVIVREYSKLLDLNIDLMQYPEYYHKKFAISVEGYKKYFRDYISRKYDMEPLIIIGFSLGSYFALDLASDPDINTSLVVLISPYMKKPNNIIELAAKRSKSFLSEQSEYADFFSYPISEVLKDLFIYNREVSGQLRRVIMNLELTGAMRLSPVRKLILIGGQDLVIPKYSTEDLSMKNSRLVIVPGGHDILVSRKLPILPYLKSFLAGD